MKDDILDALILELRSRLKRQPKRAGARVLT